MAKGGGVLELIFGAGKGSDEPEADPCAEVAEEMMEAFKAKDVDALADALRAFRKACKGPAKKAPEPSDDEDEDDGGY